MSAALAGLMLAQRKRRVDFRPELGVVQERSSGTGHGLVRSDKGVSPRDKSHAAIERFGKRTRTEFTPDLRALRERLAAGGGFPDVVTDPEPVDWYDGRPLREAVPPP